LLQVATVSRDTRLTATKTLMEYLYPKLRGVAVKGELQLSAGVMRVPAQVAGDQWTQATNAPIVNRPPIDVSPSDE